MPPALLPLVLLAPLTPLLEPLVDGFPAVLLEPAAPPELPPLPAVKLVGKSSSPEQATQKLARNGTSNNFFMRDSLEGKAMRRPTKDGRLCLVTSRFAKESDCSGSARRHSTASR
jgi:hypothetical protein